MKRTNCDMIKISSRLFLYKESCFFIIEIDEDNLYKYSKESLHELWKTSDKTYKPTNTKTIIHYCTCIYKAIEWKRHQHHYDNHSHIQLLTSLFDNKCCLSKAHSNEYLPTFE